MLKHKCQLPQTSTTSLGYAAEVKCEDVEFQGPGMSLLRVISEAATILGFMFSLAAFVQARRASNAAKQARDHIFVRTLANELENACTRMDQLLDFIQHDRVAEAGMRAHELTSALSEIPHRRSPLLTESLKNKLLTARTQAEIIEQQVSADERQPPTAAQKQRLIQVCRRTSASLREYLGTIKGRIDIGGKQ